MAVVFLAILLPGCCKSFSLNHGDFSNGDPAPGRSPGPPRAEEFVSEEYLQSSFEEDTFKAETTTSSQTVTQESTTKVDGNGAVADFCKGGKFEGNIKEVEPGESQLNLTFEHATFKSTELVRGLTYEGKFFLI